MHQVHQVHTDGETGPRTLTPTGRPAPGRVSADAGPLPGRFPPTTEAALYFCCAEVIESRSRTPHPDPLAIRIRAERDTVCLEVAAAGAGGLSAVTDLAGLSAVTDLEDRRVVRMRDRVEALGGTLRLDDGVLVTHLPVTAPDPATPTAPGITRDPTPPSQPTSPTIRPAHMSGLD